MNSKSRNDFIDVWAEKVKTSTTWRKEHNKFIDAQVKQANDFYRRLISQKNGINRFKKITGASDSFIKNFR